MALLSFEAARRVVVEEVAKRRRLPAVEQVPLDEALGRVLAEDAAIDRDLPPFDRATRDGFAVRAADLAAVPARLAVIGELAAGRAWEGRVGPGQAVEIMTGAPLPAGADAIVMVEDTERPGPREVVVRRAAAAGDNFVPAGSESRAGDRALAAGTRIDHAGIALLATVGVAAPRVYARPRVAVLPTGDEIVDVADRPGPAQIRNSNGYSMAAQAARAGATPVRLPPAADDAASLRRAVQDALARADLLVLSGGVSMGKYDLVDKVLAELGGQVLWGGVAIRPGKPAVFGRIGDGRFFFGLPGNPLSTTLTFELFARPAIELLAGAPSAPLRMAEARLGADHRQKELPFTVFVPATLEPGAAVVAPLPASSSGDLQALARADVWMLVPPGVTALASGHPVGIIPR